MAAAGVSGQFGDVKIGSTQISEVCKWNFNPKANNPAYSSNKTGGYKARVAGIKDGSGAIEGKWDPANPATAVIDVATLVTLKLYLTATVFYSVPAIIDALKIDVDIDTGDIVSFSADFSTNGAWTNPAAGLFAPAPDGMPMEAPQPVEDSPEGALPMVAPTASTDALVASAVAKQLDERLPDILKMAAVAGATEALKQFSPINQAA